MLSAYIVWKSKGKYQEAAEAARGSGTRPLGVRVQMVQKVQRVQRVVVAANASNFIGCFAAVVGALKYGWAPLTIELENRAFGARGKHANQAAPVGNAPLLPTASLHGKASHEIFSRLMAPYKFRLLATPEGEICSPLALGPHKHNKA